MAGFDADLTHVADMFQDTFRRRVASPTKFGRYVFSTENLRQTLPGVEAQLRDARYVAHTDNRLYGTPSASLPWNAVFQAMKQLAESEPTSLNINDKSAVPAFVQKYAIAGILQQYNESTRNQVLYAHEKDLDVALQITNHRDGAPAPDPVPEPTRQERPRDALEIGFGGPDQHGVSAEDLNRSRWAADRVNGITAMRRSWRTGGPAPSHKIAERTAY